MNIKIPFLLLLIILSSFAEGPRNITSPQILNGFTYQAHTTLWGVEDHELIRRELTFGFADRLEVGVVPWQLISLNAKLLIWKSSNPDLFIKQVGFAAFIGNNGLDLYDLMDDDAIASSFWSGLAVSAEIGSSPIRLELVTSPNLERIVITKTYESYVDSADTIILKSTSEHKRETYFSIPVGFKTELGKRISLIAAVGFSPVWEVVHKEKGYSIEFYDPNFTATLGIHIGTPKEMRERRKQRKARRRRR